MADARGSTATVKLGATPRGRRLPPVSSNCRRAARSSPSVASSRHTRRVDEAAWPAPARTRPSAACPRLGRGRADGGARAEADGHETTRRRVTPRPPSSRRWRRRDRPTEHLRLDGRHHPGPRLRAHRGLGAHPVVAGVRGDPPARRALHRTWSTTTSPPRWRRTSTASPTATSTGRNGCAGSTSATRRPPSGQGLRELVEDLGDIDARAISTIDLGDGIVVRVGRYGPYVEELPGEADDPGPARLPR
jgi:DNA topoisomerase-1